MIGAPRPQVPVSEGWVQKEIEKAIRKGVERAKAHTQIAHIVTTQASTKHSSGVSKVQVARYTYAWLQS